MSSMDHARKIAQTLLAELSPLEIRELSIEALRRWHRQVPDVRSFGVHDQLPRFLLPILAERKKNTTVNVDDPDLRQIFLDEQGHPWMDGFVEFLSWFIRAGFAIPSTLGPNIVTLRLTTYGRHFLELEEDHPLLPRFVERVVSRCPNLPDEVAAMLVDARVCLDHMLMRPAIALMGVGFEMAIERIFDSLVQRTIIPASQANARAAARIAAVRNAVDSALTPPPGQSVSAQLIDNRHAARHACDFADALRRRRNDASHTAPTYGFEDRQEAEDLLVSAGSHLPNLWRLA